MDKKNSLIFIEKTISKTKSKDLKWSVLSSKDIVKYLPNDITSADIAKLVSNPLQTEYSYIATYKTGQLLLLAFCPTIGKVIFTPPEGFAFSLRMQDDESRYAIEIANSQYADSACSTALIRLYNLIDKRASSVSALIDDFLNS